jgi:transcriptional regulator
MYQPPHFRIDDQEQALHFIEQHGFGMLVTNHEGRFFATHMPVMLNADKRSLVGHIARQNPQHADIEGTEVLFIIQGPHGYVSPLLYENPGVPTWNYQAVHVLGIGKRIEDDAFKRLVVDSLTHKYESAREAPWHGDYHPGKLNAITGIEIEIREIQCKFKLSQNRSARERDNIAADAMRQGNHDLASAMKLQQ